LFFAMLTPRQALLVLPGEAALLNEAGTALAAVDPAAALRWFGRAAQLSPDQPEPWANLAGALLASARIDAAVGSTGWAGELWGVSSAPLADWAAGSGSTVIAPGCGGCTRISDHRASPPRQSG